MKKKSQGEPNEIEYLSISQVLLQFSSQIESLSDQQININIIVINFEMKNG